MKTLLQSLRSRNIKPGKGGQMARSAGAGAQLVAKEGKYAQLRLPSGEVRIVDTFLSTAPIMMRSQFGFRNNRRTQYYRYHTTSPYRLSEQSTMPTLTNALFVVVTGRF